MFMVENVFKINVFDHYEPLNLLTIILDFLCPKDIMKNLCYKTLCACN